MTHILTSAPPDAFSRADERDDAIFYASDRCVSHLDPLALHTIANLIGTLVIEEHPVMLDLMASWDSHIPNTIRPERLVGLGLNERELKANSALDEFVMHDINRDPQLPFAEETFDVALCTVSVDYMVQPVEVFREVGRILRPGGLFLVTFSNRYFQSKVVKIWRNASEAQRTYLVYAFFTEAGQFDEPELFVSRGKPRPDSDKYASLGIPSDPVYAVFANKRGRTLQRPIAESEPFGEAPYSDAEIARRKSEVGDTLRCPHCDTRLKKLPVPNTPFTEWPSDFVYVCMDDRCPYFLLGWSAMTDQGASGSYRFMYEPTIGNCYSVPVWSREDLKGDVSDTD